MVRDALSIRARPARCPAAFMAAGGVVATTGGKPYVYNDVPTVIVRDLNNMFMNMQQAGSPRQEQRTASSLIARRVLTVQFAHCSAMQYR